MRSVHVPRNACKEERSGARIHSQHPHLGGLHWVALRKEKLKLVATALVRCTVWPHHAYVEVAVVVFVRNGFHARWRLLRQFLGLLLNALGYPCHPNTLLLPTGLQNMIMREIRRSNLHQKSANLHTESHTTSDIMEVVELLRANASCPLAKWNG